MKSAACLFWLLTVANLFACAPVATETISTSPVPGSDRVRSEPIGQRKLNAIVIPITDGISVDVSATDTCRQIREQAVESTKHIKRSMDSLSVVAMIIGPAALALGIPIVLGAKDEMPTPDHPMPLSKASEQVTGGIFAAAGAILTGVAIGSLIRANDEDVNVGREYVTTAEEGEAPCKAEPVPQTEVVLTTPSSPAVSLGKTNRKGRLKVKWDVLAKLFAEHTQGWAPPTAGTIEVLGFGPAGQIDLAPARAYWAGRAVTQAQRLAAEDKVDEATIQVTRAAALGADVAEVQAAIAVAPTSLARERETEQKVEAERAAKQKAIDGHLRSARQFIRSNDPNRAEAELTAADVLGAETKDLREAVANTPAARARAREEARKAEEAEKLRDAEERSGGARSPACKHALGQVGNSARMLNVFLNGTIDPLQQAMTYSAAIQLIGKNNYPLARALTQLDASAFAQAARGNVGTETFEVLRAVGAAGDKDAVRRLLFGYRDIIFFQLVGRTVSLGAWKGSASARSFRDQLLSSEERLKSYAYAVAVEYSMAPQTILGGLSSVFCGK